MHPWKGHVKKDATDEALAAFRKHAMTATVYKEPQRARKSGSLVEEHPKFRCVCVCVRRSKHCQGVVLHPQFNDPSLMRLICNG